MYLDLSRDPPEPGLPDATVCVHMSAWKGLPFHCLIFVFKIQAADAFCPTLHLVKHRDAPGNAPWRQWGPQARKAILTSKGFG